MQITQTWEPSGYYPDNWVLRGQRGIISLQVMPMVKFETNETGYQWYLEDMTWAERIDAHRPIPSGGFAKTLDEAKAAAEAALADLLAWRIEQDTNRFRQGRLFGGGQ